MFNNTSILFEWIGAIINCGNELIYVTNKTSNSINLYSLCSTKILHANEIPSLRQNYYSPCDVNSLLNSQLLTHLYPASGGNPGPSKAVCALLMAIS